MEIGFTGTRNGMSRAQAHQLQKILAHLLAPERQGSMPANEFHFGTHETVELKADAEAATLAQALGYRLVPHHATAGTELARDRAQVAVINVLIAAPEQDKEQLRSGTWTTVRYARSRVIPVVMLSRGRR